MAKLFRSKYGYQTSEWIRADARLEKWLKEKKLKDGSEMNRPFNFPKEGHEKIRIDWRKR